MATATRTITYEDQETALTGFLAWDDAAQPCCLGCCWCMAELVWMITPKARHIGTPPTVTRCWPVTCSARASPGTGSA